MLSSQALNVGRSLGQSLGIQTWRNIGRFPFTKKPEKFPLGISIWEECVPFVTSPIRWQAPLCRLDAFSKLFYYFLEQVFLRPFSAKQIRIIAYVVMRRLTSVSFHLSRCTGVETSLVNEELQKNFPELFMQHLKRKMCNGKNIFEQTRISSYYSCIRHIRTAINFPDLALWRGRKSTRSSPKSLFAKSFQKPDPAAIFVETRETPGRLKDGERHGTGDKDEKSVNGTQISVGKFPPGKRNYLFRNSIFSGNFPVERTEKSCSIYNPTGSSGIF